LIDESRIFAGLKTLFLGEVTTEKGVRYIIPMYYQQNIAFSELIKTIKIVNALRDILGENLRFDIPASGWHRRLHTKLYLNNRSAIVGSANFTRSGILSDGNWEYLLHFTKDEKLYKDALDAAHRHFDVGKGFDECERATLSLVNRLQLLDKPATSLEELENYLTELYQEISAIA
jgi:hypothetical protein